MKAHMVPTQLLPRQVCSNEPLVEGPLTDVFIHRSPLQVPYRYFPTEMPQTNVFSQMHP